MNHRQLMEASRAVQTALDDLIPRAPCYVVMTTGYGDPVESATIHSVRTAKALMTVSAELTTALRWMHPQSAALVLVELYTARMEMLRP